MENKILDINDIQKIIPHRYPFLLVDKITHLEEGKKAIGYKNVTMNEYFFQGHFPQEPVMPGVLIIEALAQVGAVSILSKDDFKGKIAYFGGINKAKFRKKVVPGDVLKLEVELVKIKGPAGIGKAVATVDGKVAAQAELLFMIG
ncbi:3-hydroxyacyl-ACP dehydratase FabZ [Clostridium oceanicum]|uniref:3-hydroxyacyl-[acyl-carrier-protein] dehydratase FabZ n=1 Tax=Clostridium oceanicum TaxID=1543 RepID=A0ABP3UZG7_9CLOT